MKKYEDIIGLSRPVSKKHPPMSRENRAAQFAPFAALTGFEGAIKETARVTGEKIELDETQKTFLDEKLKVLLREKTPALFTYFQKDEQKEGGAYITVSGIVKKTDAYTHKIVLEDGTGICVEDILEIRKLLIRLILQLPGAGTSVQCMQGSAVQRLSPHF